MTTAAAQLPQGDKHRVSLFQIFSHPNVSILSNRAWLIDKEKKLCLP